MYRWPRPFDPGRENLYPLYIRLRGPQCRIGRVWRGEKHLSLPEFETWTVQPVMSCYTEYAIHTLIIIIIIIDVAISGDRNVIKKKLKKF
jgi:hypothetical protein